MALAAGLGVTLTEVVTTAYGLPGTVGREVTQEELELLEISSRLVHPATRRALLEFARHLWEWDQQTRSSAGGP